MKAVLLRLATLRLLVAVVSITTVPQAFARQGLTVERVASLPSLIGTAPASPTWSPDSRRLAFRWNDQGMPFRDLWIVDADGSNLRRLTDLQRSHPAAAPPGGTGTMALAAQAAARASGGISEFIWSADSRALLFVLRGQLYRVQEDSADVLPLPDADEGISDLSLSPNGGTLTYLRNGDLWSWGFSDTVPKRRLTELGVDGIATVPLGSYNRADAEVGTGVWGADWMPYQWAPDGRTIALHHVDRRHIRRVPFPSYLGPETVVNELRRGYPGDENERRYLSLLDVANKVLRSIPLEAPGYRAISDYSWSRDGRLLIDQVADSGTERWLWVVEPGATTPRLVWHDRRDTRIYPAYVARWHPDGRRVVVVADLSERDHLYSIDTTTPGATPVPVTAGDWDVAGERGAASVQVLSNGNVVFTASLKNPYERHVYRTSGGDGAPVALTTLPGVHVPVLSPDGRHLASLWSDDVTPAELVVRDLQGSSPERRVTTSTPEEFGRHAWVRPRYEVFTNKIDGFRVHARILEPTGLDKSRRHPVIFGPVYSNTVRNRWGGLSGTLQQFLVQQGYIVVQVDVRGSVGYGRAFREAFLMDYGGKDLDDLQAVTDGLRAVPYVDGNRIGIWGSSYGGLLTVFSLLKRPGMFRAGVAGAPAVDPHAFGPDDVAITRSPETHAEAFVRGSALSLGTDLQDHLLIIHGLMDDVVPFRTTMALVERLILLGKDVDLATAPAATHAWTSREAYAVFFYRKLVGYFDDKMR